MLLFLASVLEQLNLALEHIAKGNVNNARFGLMLTDNAVELVLHQIAKDKASYLKSFSFLREEYEHQDALNKALGRNFDTKLKFAKIEAGYPTRLHERSRPCMSIAMRYIMSASSTNPSCLHSRRSISTQRAVFSRLISRVGSVGARARSCLNEPRSFFTVTRRSRADSKTSRMAAPCCAKPARTIRKQRFPPLLTKWTR